MNELGVSIILSTYQAGKVIVLSTDGSRMYQLVRDFVRPMGIALQEDRMAIACALNVVVLKTDANLAKSYPDKPDTYDAFYYPTMLYRTDYVDIHDIAFTNEGLVGVNTAYSCLSRLDGKFSFEPIWKPYFIEEYVPEDLCHLNGMAVDEHSTIKYVTAFGKTASKEGWRKNKHSSGVLMDTQKNEIVLDGLPMPHSPRIYNGEVYFLLSATEQLVKADLKNNTYTEIARVDGFIRGLSFKGKYAFIGVSKLRNTHTFSDLAISQKEIQAGVVIVNIETGEKVGEIKYENNVEELYDVHILEGVTRVNLFNFQQSLSHRALITPFGCSWAENNVKNEKEIELDEKK
jgi:uncharacterized protein (TIGR03032 family)